MRDIGIKKICKVLRSDVSAETLEQILDVLLQGSDSLLEHGDSNDTTTSIDLMKWLKEIITFDRFSLTVRLLDSHLLDRVIHWLDSCTDDNVTDLQLIREAFAQ